MAADVAERRRAEQGVRDGVQQYIGIRMAEQPERMRDFHPADDELAPFDEAVHIVTHAKTRHTINPFSSRSSHS